MCALVLSSYTPFSSEKRKYCTQQPRQSSEDKAVRRRAFALLKKYVESLGSEDILISEVPDSVVVNNTRLVLKSEFLNDFNVTPIVPHDVLWACAYTLQVMMIKEY